MDNQKPYIGEQTTQWSKEKVQKDKKRSTKHTYKIKDRVMLVRQSVNIKLISLQNKMIFQSGSVQHISYNLEKHYCFSYR
jgi:hypothetical protein